MVATNIDGEAVAEVMRTKIKNEINKFPSIPGLATIMVGSNSQSKKYLEKKRKVCVEAGIECYSLYFPSTISQKDFITEIAKLNGRHDIHGILIQLPLPNTIDEQAIYREMDPEKDVDGMHPLNISKLVHGRLHIDNLPVNWNHLDSVPFPVPCTPQACVELLDWYKVTIRGTRVVVIGRSNLVGAPVGHLLMHRDATVTTVHSKTRNPASIVRQADIVVAAVGKPNFVKERWLKPGCVILDVGINRVPDTFAGHGHVLTGDVDHEGARRVASQISLVPGGVGPMTLAMLLRNTVNCYKRQQMVDMRASF